MLMQVRSDNLHRSLMVLQKTNHLFNVITLLQSCGSNSNLSCRFHFLFLLLASTTLGCFLFFFLFDSQSYYEKHASILKQLPKFRKKKSNPWKTLGAPCFYHISHMFRTENIGGARITWPTCPTSPSKDLTWTWRTWAAGSSGWNRSPVVTLWTNRFGWHFFCPKKRSLAFFPRFVDVLRRFL